MESKYLAQVVVYNDRTSDKVIVVGTRTNTKEKARRAIVDKVFSQGYWIRQFKTFSKV